MIKRLCFVFSIFLLMGCEVYPSNLSGVWSVDGKIALNDQREISLSWGKTLFSKNNNGCIALDISPNNPMIYIGGQGRYPIKSYESATPNIIKLVFTFTRGGFDITCTIHKVSDSEIWIEDIKDISLFLTGKNNLYHLVSSPKK